MTTHTIEERYRLIELDSADRVERSLELGGLPTEADADELYEVLRRAHDAFERAAWRVKPFTEADHSEVPVPVTLEQLGALALVVADAKRGLADIAGHVSSLEEAVWHLGAIRNEQRSSIERYYSDPAYRTSLPCGECGAVGGCEHFPSEEATDAS